MLLPFVQKQSTLDEHVRKPKSLWVRPAINVLVEYLEVDAEGHLLTRLTKGSQAGQSMKQEMERRERWGHRAALAFAAVCSLLVLAALVYIGLD